MFDQVYIFDPDFKKKNENNIFQKFGKTRASANEDVDRPRPKRPDKKKNTLCIGQEGHMRPISNLFYIASKVIVQY